MLSIPEGSPVGRYNRNALQLFPSALQATRWTYVHPILLVPLCNNPGVRPQMSPFLIMPIAVRLLVAAVGSTANSGRGCVVDMVGRKQRESFRAHKKGIPGGGVDTCKFWYAKCKIWCGENLVQNLKYHGKMWC